MKQNHISIVTICLLTSLMLGINLMAMDDEPATPDFDYNQGKQIYRAQTIEELEQIIGDNTNHLLLKKALLLLVEKGWNYTSALKINHLLKQISTLDPGKSVVRFDDTQDDIIGYLMQNHRPAGAGRENTDLPDWIVWFAQRGVAVDALSNGSASEEGYTPLVWAVFYKRPDVVLKLLQLGAQVSTVNKPKNETPFTVLERYGDSKDPEIILIVKLLKNYPQTTDLPTDTTTHDTHATSVASVSAPAVSIAEPKPDKEPVAPAVVIPIQPEPQTQSITFASMLRPQRLLIAGGIMLALYAGYRWLSNQPAEKEDDADEGYDTPANQKSTTI